MSRMIRMDEEAFNRGVDEVLTLKPLRRALSNVVSLQSRAGKNPPKEGEKGGSVDKRSKQKPARKHG